MGRNMEENDGRSWKILKGREEGGRLGEGKRLKEVRNTGTTELYKLFAFGVEPRCNLILLSLTETLIRSVAFRRVPSRPVSFPNLT